MEHGKPRFSSPRYNAASRGCAVKKHRMPEELIMYIEPVDTPKTEFQPIIDRISLPDSPVGIDAQYTHAIIITDLQNISRRLEAIERHLQDRG